MPNSRPGQIRDGLELDQTPISLGMNYTAPSPTPHEPATDCDPTSATGASPLRPLSLVGDPDDFEENEIWDDDDPRHDRDLALSLDWQSMDQDWAAPLNLPPVLPRKRHTRNAILLQAIMAARMGYAAVSYSRRTASYVGQRRYHGPNYTYAQLVPTIDHLGQLGLLEQWTPTPGVRGLQSTFCATPLLLQAVSPALIARIVQRSRELIRLRDADRKLIDYADNAHTNRMRRNLGTINEAVTATSIVYRGLDAGHSDRAFHVGQTIVYPTKLQYRIFNGDFRHGGRIYGGGWQCAPKKARQRITIDGEPVVERDHQQLHPRLLYHMAGARLEGDAYTLPGWERTHAKRGFNILVNAHSYYAALGAIARELTGDEPHKRAAQLITALRKRHAPIKRAFHSGMGAELQVVDADMAEMVHLRLLKKGVVPLGVHDLFIVQERHQGLLDEAMAAAYAQATTPP